VKKHTVSAKKTDPKGKWVVVDADGKVLGRLASTVAARLKGKFNPLYTPNLDTGDWVVVTNAAKVVMTGRKWSQKRYYRHSGYMGGLKETTAEKLRAKRPEDVVRFAVWGMLPKNRLGRKIFRKLKVYAGDQHPHEAQQPQTLNLV